MRDTARGRRPRPRPAPAPLLPPPPRPAPPARSGGAAATTDGGFEVGGVKFGQFLRTTELSLRKASSAAGLKLTGSSSGAKGNSKLFAKGFNFEALGIGGLNKEFQDIFRRAFASRVVPPDIMKKMGQKHARGMLLFGPPGCGKTLIARQIGKALHARPPKIVNGPEILNKYVGQSEENIRALFADAEKEQAERGDDSELHIIIFDEFDAICKQRGSTGGGTGVNDSIVNQLLSKIDGVDSLNNILLIGMTNRKDMLDEAVLRPGCVRRSARARARPFRGALFFPAARSFFSVHAATFPAYRAPFYFAAASRCTSR